MRTQSQKPLYEQIYEDLKRRINEGKYPIGTKIPPEHALIAEYNVSRITIQKAVNQLAVEGLVKRRSGQGTTVIHQEELPASNTLLGLVMSGLSESYGDDLLRSICSTCEASGYSLVIKFANEDQRHEEEAVRALLAIPVRGILISPIQRSFYDQALVKEILTGFPVTVLDKEITGIDSLFVGTNHYQAAAEVAKRISDAGHHSIGLINYAEIMNFSLDARNRAFKDIYAHTNFPLKADAIPFIIRTAYLQRNNHAAVTEDIDRIKVFIRRNHPTCLIGIDNYITTLIYEAVTQLGLQVPQDICLFGFDSNHSTPPSLRYDTLVQNEQMIGKDAVTLLLRAINHEPIDKRAIRYPAQFVDNGTLIPTNQMRTDRLFSL